MAYYKDIEIPERLNTVINCMQSVETTREQLINLGQHWDLLTILGQMSGTGTDMTKTREGFKDLTAQLLTCLGDETLNKTVQDITSKAQVAVDIVIRNLFERTADIGFLATDDDIRAFLHEAKQGISEHNKELLVRRFEEYVAKYSVYDNIILLDTRGKVLAQLDATNNVSQSHDAVIHEALTTKAEYCEIYRDTDLVSKQDTSLIYAYRVTEKNNPNKALGVLCLCFRFENELQGVFENLVSADDWSVVLLLDKHGNAIASSDNYHIPVGCKLKVDNSDEFQLVKFAGRSYLAKKCETKGYQGFTGLGWSGVVMLPIEHAFESNKNSALEHIDEVMLDNVMSTSTLFSQQVQKIPRDAEIIQKELDRTVWNGNILQRGSGSNVKSNSTKVLLWEISKTGAKTQEVFEKSISQLNETVISSMLDDVCFISTLAIDIMDRNLYERANDCRWWALTGSFRKILDQNEISTNDKKELTAMLGHINDLYTVYTNLIIYDKAGKVVAVSNPTEQHLVDTRLNQNWVNSTLSIRNTQHYCVSAFEKSPLYADRHTYVYGAAINSSRSMGKVVGGIAIVFDSEPEFYAMLSDALPKNENSQIKDGCLGLFTDRNGNIIASTDNNHPVGTRLALGEEFFALENGECLSKIIEYKNYFYAVGAAASKGYREYKSEADTYVNDVITFVFMRIGAAVSTKKYIDLNPQNQTIDVKGKEHSHGQESVELGTFYIGNNWLGIPAELIKEAIVYPHVIANQHGKKPNNKRFLGPIIYKDQALPIINPILTFVDEHEASRFEKESQQVIVVTTNKGLVGIVVDTLGDIPEVTTNRIENFNNGLTPHNQFITGIVKPENDNDSKNLLVVVDPDKFIEHVMKSEGSLNLVLDEASLS